MTKARLIPVALLCVLLPAFVAGAARTTTSWTGTRTSFQGFQSTCTGMAATSVGNHTCITFAVAGCPSSFCMDNRVWADSTGNVHHKSRAEANVGAPNSRVVAGTTRIYTASVYIPSATNTRICGWHNVWQFATGFQFAGPRIDLHAGVGGLRYGLTMWTGTATGARGMAGVNPADLGPVLFNRWVPVAEKVTWSKGNTGAVTVSINGVQVFARSNVQTMPSDGVTQSWKLGPYEGDGCDAEAWYSAPTVS